MSTKLPDSITITPVCSPSSITFHTVEQIKDFADEEFTAWEPLNNNASPGKLGYRQFQQIWDAHFHTVTTLRDLSASLLDRDPSSITEDDPEWAQFSDHFSAYDNSRAFYSKLPESRYAISLGDDSPALAVSTLRYFRGDKLSLTPQNERISQDEHDLLLQGAIEARLFRRGLKGSVAAERSSLHSLRGEYGDLLKQSKVQLKSLNDEFLKIQEGFSASQDERNQAFEEQMRAAQEEVDGLVKRVKEDLRLQAPVDYWTKKRTEHLSTAKTTGKVFIGAIVIIVIALWLSEDHIIKLLDVASGKTPYGPIFFIGSIAFLAVWILRLVSRIFLINLHGYTDASERITMTNTFLALMEDPDKVTEEDRILILQALFRPPHHSASGDDGAPPHWFDIVMQRIDRGKGQ